MALSSADRFVWEAINRHGPLPTHYLFEFVRHLRRDYTHFQNRLTEFYHGDQDGPLLTRPPQQFACYGARYQHVVYGLSQRARQLLSEQGVLVVSRARRADPFVHQLMQACVGASLEIVAGTLGLRYISRADIFARAVLDDFPTDPLAISVGSEKFLVPDDLFGLEYPGAGFRFFAVEIDRNTESIERKNLAQSAFGTKIAGYLNVLRQGTHRTHWGIPNLHVLTVTTNATHAHHLAQHVAKVSDPAYVGRFAFATASDFGANWRVPKRLLTHLVNCQWNTATGPKDISAP